MCCLRGSDQALQPDVLDLSLLSRPKRYEVGSPVSRYGKSQIESQFDYTELYLTDFDPTTGVQADLELLLSHFMQKGKYIGGKLLHQNIRVVEDVRN